MLSKNNHSEQIRKQAPKQQRFAIKKLTVGVASVLIGFTYMGVNQAVHADTTTPTEQPAQSKQAPVNSATTGNQAVLTKAPQQEANQPAQQSQPTDAKTPAQTPVAPSQDQTKQAAQATDQQKQAQPTQQQNQQQQKVAPTVNLAAATPQVQNSQTVNSVSELQSALNDGNVTNIVIGSNFTGGASTPTQVVVANSGVARQVTITSLDPKNNPSTLDLGGSYFYISNTTQSTGQGWDIIFDGLKIRTTSTYGPIYFNNNTPAANQAKDYITFQDVTTTNDSAELLGNTSTQVNVRFKGTNNIYSTLNTNDAYSTDDVVYANSVEFVDGTTNFHVSMGNANVTNTAYGNVIHTPAGNPVGVTGANGSALNNAVTIDSGATVNISGATDGDNVPQDVKGIVLVNSNNLAGTPSTGTVQVDGALTENMGKGHSVAILAGNLNIAKNGSVTINTQQDNNNSKDTANAVENYNGFHYAPISLGVGANNNGTNADSNTLDDQGKLVIIRTGNPSTLTPLISFGSVASAVSKGQFTLNVTEGATLDLQDSSVSPTVNNNQPLNGMISMWGGGNTTAGSTATTFNHINITNPGYVNLQRTGSQTGSLIRLENTNNKVNIIGNGGNLPLAEWSEGNTTDGASFVWYLTQLQSQNNWGTNATSGFTQAGQATGINKGGVTFLNSNGSVTLGSNQAGKDGYTFNDGKVTQGAPDAKAGVSYQTPYMNQLLNQFNWWTSQRIAMGSKLADNKVNISDADKYNPETETIDATTSQKLTDLTADNGIKDLLSTDGQVVSKDGLVTDVAWTKDANGNYELTDASGNAVDATQNFPAAGDYTANATVTYKDGTTDIVSITIHVTDNREDAQYTPQTKPNEVAKGATPVAKDGISGYKDKDGNIVQEMPNKSGQNEAPTVTWTNTDPATGMPKDANGKTIDTNVPGIYDNVPATVTYPDGSVDTNVPETIVVGNVVDVTNNGNHNDPSVPNAIPDGYELVTVNAKHGHFGADTTATTKKYLVKDGTSKDEFLTAVAATADDGYDQSTEAWDPQLPDTFKTSDTNKSYNVSFQAIKDSTLYQPSYDPTTAQQGKETKTGAPKYTPSADGKVNVPGSDGKVNVPDGTTYAKTDNTPDWVKSVDAKTGVVTLAPTADTKPGAYNIPVKVTYPDTSSETVYVPVIVTDANGDQTVTWGDNGAVVTTVNTDKLGAHETSDHSQVLNAAGAVTAVGYQMKDGKLSTDPTPITIDPSTVSWNSTPDTNVDTATAAGKQIENQTIKVDLTNNQDAKNILGSKDGVVTTAPFTIKALGAGAKTNVVDVQLGSDLTDTQFRGLVDNNIPTDEIASTAWATKPDKDGNGGVIKITFTDKGKDGNPTYLNINIPAGSLHIITDADTYEPTTKPNEVKNGVTSIPAENGIANMPGSGAKGELPAKTTVTWDKTGKDQKGNEMPIDPATGKAIDTSKPGIYDNVPATVNYPDGTSDKVKETVVVGDVINVSNVPGHNDPTKDPAPDGYVYETFQAVNGTFAPLTDAKDSKVVNPTTQLFLVKKGAKVDVLSQLNPQANAGYDQLTGTWSPDVPAEFTEAGTYTITFYKAPQTTPIETTPGQLPSDPSKGISNMPTGDGSTNNLPGDTKVTWGDGAQDTINKGKPGDTVDVPAVIHYPNGKDETVTIPVTITKPTDADTNQPDTTPITTDPGKLPDPSQGITNMPGSGAKDELPGDTKVIWQDPGQAQQTIDHAKPGDTVKIPAVVIYPDGSKDVVDITITINVPKGNGEATGATGNGNGNGNGMTGNGTAATIKSTAKQTMTTNNGQAKAKTLPQTGNQAEKGAAVAGMAMLTAALGLFGLKKKED